jgi:hypothetical protein
MADLLSSLCGLFKSFFQLLQFAFILIRLPLKHLGMQDSKRKESLGFMNQLEVHIKWQVLRTRFYLERLHVKAFFLPAFVFVISTLCLSAYYYLNQYTHFWEHWNVANGNAFGFCEMNRMDQLVRQPSNTWSNLGYFLVGLFALTLGVHDMKVCGAQKVG